MSTLKVNALQDTSGNNLSRVGQVVQTIKTDTTSTSSTSMTDCTGMSVTITPTSTSSKILVTVIANVGAGSGYRAMLQLVRGSTAIGIGTSVGSRQACGMSSRDQDNGVTHNNVQRIYQPIALSAAHLMGVGPKTDSGFNDVMGNIADNNPLSPMADKYGTSKTASQRKARDTFSRVTKKYKNKLNNLNK